MNTIKYLLIPIIALAILYPGCSKNEKSGDKENGTSRVEEYWTCTMHPQVRMDHPGVCPICNMDLIKKTVEINNAGNTGDKEMANMITLSGNKQVLANVTTIKVTKETLQKEITVYSYLDFAEQSRKIISARFNGRIEKLFVNKTGDYIKKNQPLFEIYSPDLVQAQNEYLIALDNNMNSESGSLLVAAQSKLELFGVTDAQIKELKNTHKIKNVIAYYSPISGTVIEKKVQEGMYVSEGTSIYDVAELSTLWNISEVYEKDLSYIKIGSSAELHLKAYPEEVFNGTVTFIYPVVNSQTRTVRVRSEFNNHSGKLKSQMYGETIFSVKAGQGLLIQADAIIFSGKKTVVWVKVSEGMFEAHEVNIGGKFGDKYQILSGLNENDEIAASGGFLIDSESQLKTGMPTGHQHGEESTQDTEKKEENSGSSEHKNH